MESYLGPMEAAAQLKIKTSTIRKYSRIMEEAGHEFTKGENGKRFYRDTDVITLKRIITEKNNSAMPLNQLIQSIVGEIETPSSMISETPHSQHTDDTLPILEQLQHGMNEMHAIKEMIGEQSSQMEKQSARMDRMLDILAKQQEEIMRLNDKIEGAEKKKVVFSKMFKKS